MTVHEEMLCAAESALASLKIVDNPIGLLRREEPAHRLTIEIRKVIVDRAEAKTKLFDFVG